MKKLLVLMALVSAFTTVHAAFAGVPGKDVAVFFEIPVTNMERAATFYENIMAVKLTIKTEPGYTMAFFPSPEGAISGALSKYAEAKPSAEGTILYLNGGADLQAVLDRVVPAGGQVIVPKTLISPEVGYFAHFLDTEGNRLGLFSTK
ncbi:MAG: VOC family protein [Bdellovibrionota bacterium]